MNSAFVLANETILCHQTAEGWWPISLSLSTDLPLDQQPDAKAIAPAPLYRAGHVSLLAPLDKDSAHYADDAPSNAHVTDAITYAYALKHKLALPDILDAATANMPDTPKNTAQVAAFIPYRQLVTTLPYAVADQLSQAIQLLRWQADTQFCSRCGNQAVPAQLGERAMVCTHCDLRQYPRVQPCVITAITRPNPKTGETQILLAHHHRYGKSVLPMQYGLIAGFVEVGESLENAVGREVMEEVGIALKDIQYVSSQPWPYPSNLMVGFRARYQSGDIVLQIDELSHADFFDLSNLPKIPSKGSIAYDLIRQILDEESSTLSLV